MMIGTQYQWPTDGTMIQSMWGPGQPSDNQLCSHMVVNGNDSPMDDVDCSLSAQYICEISKFIPLCS